MLDPSQPISTKSIYRPSRCCSRGAARRRDCWSARSRSAAPPDQVRPLGCRSWVRYKPSTPGRQQARAGAPRAAPICPKAVESAALEAAGSNTRGSGWAPSGPASGSECPPGTARRALRRRTRRARALRRQHVDRAAAPRPRREAPSISWPAQARRSTHSARAGSEVLRTSRGCARPRLAVAALAPGLQPARRARPLCLQLRGVRVARRDAFARGRLCRPPPPSLPRG